MPLIHRAACEEGNTFKTPLVAVTFVILGLFAVQQPRNFPSGPPTAPFIKNLYQLAPTKIFMQQISACDISCLRWYLC